jgi:hypothetical protein
MALDLDIIAADMAAIIADFPDSITVDGQSYVVAASGVQRGQTLDVGGFMADITFQFSGMPSVISGIAILNKRVTYKGKTYRIARVFPDNTGGGITCYCVDDAK